MAKVYSITDKLSAENTAQLEVFGEKLEFKTDARTVFTALEIADKDMGIRERYETLQELLFTEKSADKLTKMKLPFASYQIVVETAFNIAIGRDEEEEAQGELQTRDMT